MSRIHSPTYREKRKKRVIRWSIFGVILVLVLVGGSIYAARNHRFVISNVSVTGASFSDPQKIQAEAFQDISGDYVFVYPKADELFYPKKKIEADILRDFPAVQSVSVSLDKKVTPSGLTLDISVKERQPFALWCGDEIQPIAVDASGTPIASGADLSQCYFADSQGFIFSEAPHFSGDLYPVFYGGLGEATDTRAIALTTADASTTDPDNAIGNSILTPDKLAHVISFAQSTDALGFKVSAYQITEDPSGDICDLYYGAAANSYLRVDCDDDFTSISADLASFISDPHFSTSTPAGYRYIDLRFGDKIVYKRK